MKIKSMRERLLASSMICSAAILGLAATPALAQDAEGEVSEIVVTGTRIPSPNLESVSPVTAIGAADIKAQGITRVEDMVNSLPQAFAAQGAALSNGSTGTATVNLRGLGATRTMVLIDGRRLMPGTPNTLGPAYAADLNFIPSSLVERVDVLTGGASAVYGADAVAGVVNFIMQRDFEGVRLDAQYGIYQHKNDSPIADVVRASAAASATPEFFGLPDENVRDGESSEITLILGVNAPDGRGNITAYAGYRHVEPILQINRDFSACTLNSGDSFAEAGCGGSGTAFPARFGPLNGGLIVDLDGPGNTFRTSTGADVYNFGPLNYYQRPDDRYVMGAFARYQVADWAEAYADIMFMDDRSTYQIAPGGIFAGTFSVNCANPLLSAQQRALLPAVGGGSCADNPAGTFTGTVARRNIEGGGRQGSTEHVQYRYILGLRGQLGENWNYDAFLQYGRVSYNQVQTGFFRTTAIQNALNVVINPATGQPVCASVLSGTDAACVPYNIFQIGGVTPAALNYLETPSFQTGNLHERVANISLGGNLTEYGLKSPWAADGVGVSVGAEYRREQLDFAADFVASAGLLNGSGGANPPVDGSYDVYELFGEARIPLIQDMPFVRSLTAEAAYRFSDYSSSGITHTYKLAGDWEPVEDLRLRASYQRAVRTPNVLELFSPQNVVLNGTTDPCAGLAAGDSLVARCAQAFGLSTAQVLAIEENPANQYNGRVGGNPNLDPETSDTYSVGFVYQPSYLPGLNLSVDWFDIKVKDYIQQGINQDLVLTRCLDSLDPFFCGLVNRDAQGSLFLSPQGFVEASWLNSGALRTSGVDINAGYRTDLDRFGLDNMGGISFSFVGTWLDELSTQPLPGDPYYDCAGLYGAICSSANAPNPKWRHKARLTWNTPLTVGDWVNSLGVSVQWRHFDSISLDAFDSDPQLSNPDVAYESDRVLASRDYFDLTATWTMKDSVNFRLGVNNVFDKDPPLTGSSNCPTGPCNGNTWPQIYDAFGRYIFLGMTADF
ncbi:TonB-dependent receptor plug domain-containing protein [Phenylobacterium sp.]|uniref:TonB-dependent receptor plug domain-containing protein n=1 Tax=Phenylobacterium sp. TaxID=1871053 RepID=UPI002FE18C25